MYKSGRYTVDALEYGVNHGWFAQTARIPTRFDTQVDLLPGDYKLSVTVTDGTSVGRAEIPLHVQDFDGRKLAISDIALAGIIRDASWVARDAASVFPAPIISFRSGKAARRGEAVRPENAGRVL